MLWKIPGWVDKFMEVQAERGLQDYAKKIVRDLGLEASALAYLAETNTPLSELLVIMDVTVQPIEGAAGNPVGRYLSSLPDAKVLQLLREVMPDHVAVLDRFPNYAHKLIAEIKGLLLGTVAQSA